MRAGWYQNDFEATIRILTPEEGGRRSPAFNGIRWDFVYRDGPDRESFDSEKDYFCIYPMFCDEQGAPVPEDQPLSGTMKAEMFILRRERRPLHRSRIREGTEFTCMEGPRVVAEGVVTRFTGLLDVEPGNE